MDRNHLTELIPLSLSEEVIAAMVGRGFVASREVAQMTGLKAQVAARVMRSLAMTGHIDRRDDGTYSLMFQFTPLDELILRSLTSSNQPIAGPELIQRCHALRTPRKIFFMSVHRLTGAGYIVECDDVAGLPTKKCYAPTGKKPRIFEAPQNRMCISAASVPDQKQAKLKVIAEDRLRVITPILNAQTRDALTIAKGLANYSNISLSTIFIWLEKYDPLDPIRSLMPTGLRGHHLKALGSKNNYAGNDHRPHISISSPVSQRIVKALKEYGPMTIRQLAETAHVAPSTLKSQNYLADLCDAGLIHIADWERAVGGGRPSAVYEHGKGKNVPYPGPIPDSVLSAAKRRRRKERQVQVAKAAGINAIMSALSSRSDE